MDLHDPVFIAQTSILSLAYLRVGGTKADSLCYNVTGVILSSLPSECTFALQEERLLDLCSFVNQTSLKLVFGVNNSPGAQHAGGWNPSQPETMFAFLRSIDCPIGS